MGAPLVVFAWGNPSRTDDALAPELLARLMAEGLAGVTAIEDFQLQIEHVLDLDGADLALFIDAAAGDVPPVAFREVTARESNTCATHALEPEQLLGVYRRAMAKEPPPAFVLAIRGEDFAIGEGMTDRVRARLEAVWPFLRDLCARPDVQLWRTTALPDPLVSERI